MGSCSNFPFPICGDRGGQTTVRKDGIRPVLESARILYWVEYRCETQSFVSALVLAHLVRPTAEERCDSINVEKSHEDGGQPAQMSFAFRASHGRWTRLNFERRFCVDHPCGFVSYKGGAFLLPLF